MARAGSIGRGRRHHPARIGPPLHAAVLCQRLYGLAQAETEIGDRAQGEAILGELLTADPNDEEALVLLGESHLRLDAARALIEKQRFDEARTMLAPVVSNPHGGAEAQAARDLLKTLPGEAPA